MTGNQTICIIKMTPIIAKRMALKLTMHSLTTCSNNSARKFAIKLCKSPKEEKIILMRSSLELITSQLPYFVVLVVNVWKPRIHFCLVYGTQENNSANFPTKRSVSLGRTNWSKWPCIYTFTTFAFVYDYNTSTFDWLEGKEKTKNVYIYKRLTGGACIEYLYVESQKFLSVWCKY